MTAVLSFCLTSAPITPNEVKRRYSNGRVFEVVLRKGYKKSGMCAINQNQQKSFESLMKRITYLRGKVGAYQSATQHIAAMQGRYKRD